ncbi:cytochrome P450 [Rubrobacter xylanophilus DSM 9941]|uniref:Cytochrome P450 n=1 Tax=Rubrobacter xylanophilus (strain DSM 9941 / JCM 11954 / NBRC 16129 / PRD-1) TaxID=266117 RepID=Q1AX80_RUBXD|nr:cytochrome P450 [Rubrobacter xylanophilus]ABG03998.1 cytochrome P450 [Rubrobacter xylanophilus DSM 9941]
MTQIRETVPLEEIDLSDPDAFVERVPHEWFRTLRREAPVFFNPEPDGPGFWVVSRYEDIREVHRRWDIYSSEIGGTSLEDLEPDQIEARKSMIDLDPPRHDEIRRLIRGRFSPRAVKEWEDQVREVARRVIEEALPKGEFDFVREISSEIPMQIFADILGVPQEERRYIIEIGDHLLGNQDPEFARPPEKPEHRLLPFSSPAALELFRIGRALAAERRRNPRDDIITQMAFGGLTQREFDVNFVLLATAGNETTRHTITHGLLALIENPDQLERLRRDPSLYPSAAEEMLRWATPVHHFRRTTTRETELAGTRIPAGAKVTTWFTSGNRDETVFERADAFDVGREPSRHRGHMTFGPGGKHFCLGAHLARMEVRVTFEELIPRLRSVELAGPVDRLRSNFFNGIKRMPVRVEAA